jgi:hypothetical protein
MGDDFDFSDTVMDLWLSHQNESELENVFDDLGSKLLAAKQEYAEIREYDEQLFGEDFET